MNRILYDVSLIYFVFVVMFIMENVLDCGVLQKTYIVPS